MSDAARGRVHVAVLVGVGLVLLGLTIGAWWAMPWLRGPMRPEAEVLARWERIVAGGATTHDGGDGRDVLGEVFATADALVAGPPSALDEWDAVREPPPADWSPTDATARARAALTAWHALPNGRGRAFPIDFEIPSSIALMKHVAADPATTGADIAALLALGSEFRRGGSGLHYALGLEIADACIAWAQRQDGTIGLDAFRRERPDPAEIVPAMCREIAGIEADVLNHLGADSNQWFMRRQILVAREIVTDHVLGLLDCEGDLDAMLAARDAIDRRDLEGNLLAPLWLPTSMIVRRHAESNARFARLLGDR